MRKLIIIALTMLSCGIVFKASSQRPSNDQPVIRVAVYSTNTSEVIHIEDLIKSSIKTELRKLGTLEIMHVGTGEWDHLIHIQVENPHRDILIVAVNYHSKVPERFMTAEWKKNSVESQIYPVTFPHIGYIHTSILTETENVAKHIVARYNNSLLQYTLDSIRLGGNN